MFIGICIGGCIGARYNTFLIALIYLSHIKKKMQQSGLFKTYTMGTLLDKLDIIECFESPGQKLRVGEVLKKQTDIYKALDVDPPASL